MIHLVNYPRVVFVLSLAALWFAALTGAFLRQKRKSLDEYVREDLDVVLASSLTLLGLIIGFTFSMAITRYDQRKNHEEDESNAIGTEYVRADFLPDADASKARELLRAYLEQRILYYVTRDESRLHDIGAATAVLQADLWSTVRGPASTRPTPVLALVASGMNDVLNSQGYTQAAWRNRIPVAAWALMAAIALCCNVMVGFGGRRPGMRRVLLIVLPLVVSIAFFLIADIDSPRRGIIRVIPLNLNSLLESLPASSLRGPR